MAARIVLGRERRVDLRPGTLQRREQGLLGRVDQSAADRLAIVAPAVLLLLDRRRCCRPGGRPRAGCGRPRCRGTPAAPPRARSAGRDRPPSPTANTAAIRSCRMPRSRRWHLQAVGKEGSSSSQIARRRSAGEAIADSLPLRPTNDHGAAAGAARSRGSAGCTPRPARRSANGSFEPVGRDAGAKKPTSVSSLSARATTTLVRRRRAVIVRALGRVVLADRRGHCLGLALRARHSSRP